jgi:thiosulfate reductase cytochrome b subunit
MSDKEFEGRPLQPLPIRITHWIAVPVIVLMAGSGLQIYAAYPALGPRGAQYAWFPFQNMTPPAWLRFGGWLAGARHWHFALAWFVILNGVVYLAYLFARGEWRRRLFLPQRDLAHPPAMFLYYLRIRKTPPPVDFYNGLQRLAYTSAIIFGVVIVWSGLALYKPVQLHFLTVPFGGYDGARTVHFIALWLLVGFFLTHLVLVALHPREMRDMLTGGGRE